MQKKQDDKKLNLWKSRLRSAQSSYGAELERMDEMEKLYDGIHELQPITSEDYDVKDRKINAKTGHCWNIIAENIESEIDNTIPMPKVTARRPEHEALAKIIENMLRNELDRMPLEEINDLAERIVPTQGGVYFMPEWDETEKNGLHVGENRLTVVHPKELIPQPGVYSDINDMDWFFLRLPQTKGTIRSRYGVDVSAISEEEPEARGVDESNEDDMVTQFVAYYHNASGGIGKFSWVGDVVLEDIEDYHVRRVKRCAKCGALQNAGGLIMQAATPDGTYPQGEETGKRAKKDECPYCGGTKWETSEEEYEEIYVATPVGIRGEVIGGSAQEIDALGNVVVAAQERIPYYKPDCYPVVLQKNISVFGKLLGESDAEKIKDQQNTLNRLEQKIIDRICKAGSKITLPEDTNVSLNATDGDIWRLRNPSDKNMIGVYDFTGNLQYEMAYLGQVYEESRRILGITDSWQGRADTTAKSGVAKQFAAAQSAGRMESKRRIKQAAYQKIFEILFKNRLAYSSEPLPIVYTDETGAQKYDSFDRHMFLERDEAGEWRYITDFIFSCDESSGLAQNRAQMWQEITAQFQSGAFGNPADLQTLVLYWTKMEQEHYPGASQTKKYISELREQQLEQQAAQMQQLQQMQQTQLPPQAEQGAYYG